MLKLCLVAVVYCIHLNKCNMWGVSTCRWNKLNTRTIWEWEFVWRVPPPRVVFTIIARSGLDGETKTSVTVQLALHSILSFYTTDIAVHRYRRVGTGVFCRQIWGYFINDTKQKRCNTSKMIFLSITYNLIMTYFVWYFWTRDGLDLFLNAIKRLTKLVKCAGACHIKPHIFNWNWASFK